MSKETLSPNSNEEVDFNIPIPDVETEFPLPPASSTSENISPPLLSDTSTAEFSTSETDASNVAFSSEETPSVTTTPDFDSTIANGFISETQSPQQEKTQSRAWLKKAISAILAFNLAGSAAAEARSAQQNSAEAAVQNLTPDHQVVRQVKTETSTATPEYEALDGEIVPEFAPEMQIVKISPQERATLGVSETDSDGNVDWYRVITSDSGEGQPWTFLFRVKKTGTVDIRYSNSGTLTAAGGEQGGQLEVSFVVDPTANEPIGWDTQLQRSSFDMSTMDTSNPDDLNGYASHNDRIKATLFPSTTAPDGLPIELITINNQAEIISSRYETAVDAQNDSGTPEVIVDKKSTNTYIVRLPDLPAGQEVTFHFGRKEVSSPFTIEAAIIGANEEGSVEDMGDGTYRIRRAENGDYLTWTVDKGIRGARVLEAGESIAQTKADVLTFDLQSPYQGELTLALDPAALIQQTGEDGQLQEKTPYETALDNNPEAILAAFVSVKPELRGTTFAVEFRKDGQSVDVFDFQPHVLAKDGGPTTDTRSDSEKTWVMQNHEWTYQKPSAENRDQDNSWVELPATDQFDQVVISGDLSALDFVNIGVLKSEPHH